MSRRKEAPVRRVQADPHFNSKAVTKFVNRMMFKGKKTISFSNLYGALDFAEKKTGKEPLEIFQKALENVKPNVEVKSRRVGGATYQVPVEVREVRREALAMRWIIQAARARSGRNMRERLGAEFVDAANSTGVAFKKKEDTHRMAEANKAFSHYRW